MTESQKDIIKKTLKKINYGVRTGLLFDAIEQYQMEMAKTLHKMYPDGLPKAIDEVIDDYDQEDLKQRDPV